MGFDEYDYLEKNLDKSDPPQNKIERSSKRKTETKAADDTVKSSSRRRRLSPTDDRRSRDRDGYTSSRGHSKKHRDGRDKDRARDKMRKRDQESDRERDYERKEKRKQEQRSHRRSRSRSERHVNERDRDKSKDRENESGKDYKERVHDIRPHKCKKEEIKVDVDPERDQRTVFAYQITQKADERDIFEFFSQAGKVRDVRLVMDRMSRRSRGVGYVEFVDAMSVPMAISLSGQPLLGQPVMVKPSEAEKNLVQPTASTGAFLNGAIGPYSGGARRLYVSNLHLNMKDDQLRQVFEAFGTVEMVQLPSEPETGHCKGFGFVQFERLEDARAAESLNGQLEIAGHLIKVSAATDQIFLETGSDFDGYEGGGLVLNGSSRALLMQKLDRSGTLLSGSLVHASLPALSAPPVTVPSFDLVGVPGECLLLKNMFDPKVETGSDFELDIKEDIKEECSKFGTLRHVYVDKESAGFVYLRFKNTEAAMSAQRALHGRWFAGKMITATFMVSQDYEAKFPDNR